MMRAPEPPICVAALYLFTPFEDCDRIRIELATLCRSAGVKGTLLLAREGINGTIASDDSGIATVLRHIQGLPGCAELNVKFSRAAVAPFHHMKVRIKAEIVTMGQPNIDPLASGHYVAPEDWNALIASPDTILIDTRNDYEVAMGSFAGAIDPKTATFRDFPTWFRAHRDTLFGDVAAAKVAMFCTGGIRCEKATAFLRSEGVDVVYHLKGGILEYLSVIPAEQSRWEGECFVFDRRVAVTHELAGGTYELCHACRHPVADSDRALPSYEAGIRCRACDAERSDVQRTGYTERMRQAPLAEERGVAHVGAILPQRGD